MAQFVVAVCTETYYHRVMGLRDAIVEKGTAIAAHFYSSILNDYCIEKSLAEPTSGIIDHTKPQLAGRDAWFDPLIRIADHFAGPLAQINYDAIVPGQKQLGHRSSTASFSPKSSLTTRSCL
jgi:hypothetical protein